MNEADRETAERHSAIREEFCRLPAVSVCAGRPQMPPGATAIMGIVIPVEDAAVHRALREVVQPLADEGLLQPFPEDYWHITVVPPVFIGEGTADPPRLMPESFLKEALAKARRTASAFGPIEVTVRGLNAFREVLVAVVYDGGRGLELGRLLRSAVPELPDRYPTGHELLPHISLAQYISDERLEEIVSLVEGEAETEFGRFQADRLDMFILRGSEGRAEEVEKLPIALAGP